MSTLVNIPSLHKPCLKSLSHPAIFSYPSNTPSACRWRACSPAVHLSIWYVTFKTPVSSSSLSLARSSAAENTRGISFPRSLIRCISFLPTLSSETCIKGHRSSSCKHTDRPLFEIKKKGRPVTQCEHCRELRKTKQVHVKCICESRIEPSYSNQGVLNPYSSSLS